MASPLTPAEALKQAALRAAQVRQASREAVQQAYQAPPPTPEQGAPAQ